MIRSDIMDCVVDFAEKDADDVIVAVAGLSAVVNSVKLPFPVSKCNSPQLHQITTGSNTGKQSLV